VSGGGGGAAPTRRALAVERIDGARLELTYDQLVVALGSVSRTLPIPGLAEHAIGLKSLADATALRNQVLGCLDIAESLEDPTARAEYLGFVFVGAGYAGVEGLAELQDFVAQAIELYPRCRAQGMSWVLVEAGRRIMQEVPESLSEFAERELRGRGIEVYTGMTLREVAASSVLLSDGETIPARTVVWTAGVKPSPVLGTLGLPLDQSGRVVVDRTMRVDVRRSEIAGVAGGGGAGEVWAIGDCAAVPDAYRPGQSCPPTAQHAIRQGRLVARNVVATLGGGRVRPFRYRTKGVVAELGHNRAVAITLGIRWRGFPAWFIARTYHLLLMPGLGRKLRLLADWNVALVFGRDASAPGRLGSPTPLEPDREPPFSPTRSYASESDLADRSR
jgi:NADH dehydrogenase